MMNNYNNIESLKKNFVELDNLSKGKFVDNFPMRCVCAKSYLAKEICS